MNEVYAAKSQRTPHQRWAIDRLKAFLGRRPDVTIFLKGRVLRAKWFYYVEAHRLGGYTAKPHSLHQMPVQPDVCLGAALDWADEFGVAYKWGYGHVRGVSFLIPEIL